MRGTLMRRPLASTDPFFDRLFSEFLRPVAPGKLEEDLGRSGWMPAVDVKESDEAYTIVAELPGLTKKDVEVSLENNVLTIKGEREFESKEEENNYHRIERAYGSFSRSFTVPREVDAEKVKARFKEGLLSVEIPKVEKAKPRKIDIG